MLVPEEGAFDGRQVRVADVGGAAVPSSDRLQLRPVVPEGVPCDRRDWQRRAGVENIGPRPAQSTGVVQRRTYTPQGLMPGQQTRQSAGRTWPRICTSSSPKNLSKPSKRSVKPQMFNIES